MSQTLVLVISCNDFSAGLMTFRLNFISYSILVSKNRVNVNGVRTSAVATVGLYREGGGSAIALYRKLKTATSETRPDKFATGID